MVDIALDPNMYYRTMSTVRTLYKAAELGFEYVELSPNADFHFWHHRPAADDAFVAELNKAQKETGVKVRTLNPVFNWSSPDEEERRAQVSNWRRLLELADQIDVREITSEFSGDRNRARRSEEQWFRSIEELIPDFERYGIRLNMEAHPYDFVELHDPALNLVRAVNKDWLGYEFCCPHAFHLSDGAGDVERMIRTPTASTTVPTTATATSSTRPALTSPSISTTRSATARSTGTPSFPRCATSASTACSPCASSAGTSTPTTSTAECWPGSTRSSADPHRSSPSTVRTAHAAGSRSCAAGRWSADRDSRSTQQRLFASANDGG